MMIEQLTIDMIREHLLEAVTLCSQVVKKTDSIPAFQCLRLEVKDGNLLQVPGLSREITVINSIPARVVHAGEPVAIFADRLAAHLEAMPENETVRMALSGALLKLTAARHSIKMNVLDWNLLPVTDMPIQTTVGTLTNGGEGIFRGFYAADNDGLLAALRLDVKEGNLIVSGSNRYRGVTMSASLDQNHHERVFSLPRDTASLVLKLFKDKTVTVSCNHRYIAFSAGDLTMLCITLAAAPSDFIGLMPADFQAKMTLPTKAFRKEVRAAKASCNRNFIGKASTGKFRKPAFDTQKGSLETILADARHVKAHPVARPMARLPNGSPARRSTACSRDRCCES